MQIRLMHQLSDGKLGAALAICLLLTAVSGLLGGSSGSAVAVTHQDRAAQVIAADGVISPLAPSDSGYWPQGATFQFLSQDDPSDQALVPDQHAIGVIRTVQNDEILDYVSPVLGQRLFLALLARGPPCA